MVCKAKRIRSHRLLLHPQKAFRTLFRPSARRPGLPLHYQCRDYVLRFIRSLTNVFPQDIVVSEQFPPESLFEYVAVVASRTTMRLGRGDHSASQAHPPTAIPLYP